MRKLIASALLMTLIMSATSPVCAMPLIEESGEPLYERIQAYVMNVNEINDQVMVRRVADNQIILLNIGDETFVVDAVNGLNTTLEERLNNLVEIYHSPAMSHSDPPVTNALALLINIPEDYTLPRFHIAERIASYNGGLRVSVDNGGLIVTLSGDGDVTAPLMTSTGQSVDLSKVREGSKLLLWYEAVALSHPAQTTATRAVLLIHSADQGLYEPANQEAGADGSEAEAYGAEANNNEAHTYGAEAYTPPLQEPPDPPGAAEVEKEGYTLHVSGARELAGDLWIPLRQVAEGLGYTVIWNSADQSVEIILRGGISARVVISQNGQLFDEKTYVSVGFFEQYSGRTERINDVIVFY